MARNIYTKEQKEFIAENIVGTRIRDMVEIVNAKFGTKFTVEKMRAFMRNHKLANGLPKHLPPGKPSKQFPQHIKDFIADNHKGVGPTEMTQVLNNKFGTEYKKSQILSYYKNHNINSGLTGYFDKSHKPWNKGMKGLDIGGKETQFKKGHVPANYKPIGSERITIDGYTEVKVADPNKWRLKHRVIWEKENGPIPKGHVLLFGDKNQQNFNMDNLILISRNQLARLNQNNLIQTDAELTRTGIIIADLKIKMSERTRSVKS